MRYRPSDHWMLPVVMFVLLLAVSPASADRMQELKDRFQARYPTLVQLKNAGKVGETTKGLVDVVNAAYGSEKVNEKYTIGSFVAEENTDRQALYGIIAQQQKTTPDLVAGRAAKRNFERAEPNEYLKLDNGTWVQKKNLPKE